MRRWRIAHVSVVLLGIYFLVQGINGLVPYAFDLLDGGPLESTTMRWMAASGIFVAVGIGLMVGGAAVADWIRWRAPEDADEDAAAPPGGVGEWLRAAVPVLGIYFIVTGLFGVAGAFVSQAQRVDFFSPERLPPFWSWTLAGLVLTHAAKATAGVWLLRSGGRVAAWVERREPRAEPPSPVAAGGSADQA